MNVDATHGSWWRYWPCMLAGPGVLLSVYLSQWLPSHFAVAISSFLTWFVAGLFLARYFPRRSGLPAWLGALLAAAAAGSVGGLMSYLLHWP